MTYVPGNAAEGYCATCDEDTLHTVLEIEGLQIRCARCSKCSTEGPFRVSRAKARAGLMAYVGKRATIPPPPRRQRKKAEDPAQIYRRMMEGKKISEARTYKISMALSEGDILRHPRFGVGIVSALTGPQKAVVVFEDGPKNLVFGR